MRPLQTDRVALAFFSRLLVLEARIVLRDALCFAQNAVRVGISLAAPREHIALTLGGQGQFAQASFRGLASFVMGKDAPDCPLAQWSALVHLIGAWYCGRNHQAPSHKGERGGVADLHAVFVAAWSNSSNDA